MQKESVRALVPEFDWSQCQVSAARTMQAFVVYRWDVSESECFKVLLEVPSRSSSRG